MSLDQKLTRMFSNMQLNESSDQCELKSISNHRVRNTKVMFLVNWKDCKSDWEHEHNMNGCSYALSKYLKTQSTTNKTLIYVRVSSKAQTQYNQGHTSLQVQETHCRFFARQNNLVVFGCFRDEGVSARYNSKLLSLKHAVKSLSSGDTLLFYDTSRFSRNMLQGHTMLEDLRLNGVRIVSVNDRMEYGNAEQRHYFRMKLSFSENQSDQISEKVKASVAYRKARGDYFGKAPFGFETYRDETGKIKLRVDMMNNLIIDMIRNPSGISPSVELSNSRHFKRRTMAGKIAATLVEKDVKVNGKDPTTSFVKRILERDDTKYQHYL
jgi:DNA invertase Pin-like site-specific DNA recombinase